MTHTLKWSIPVCHAHRTWHQQRKESQMKAGMQHPTQHSTF